MVEVTVDATWRLSNVYLNLSDQMSNIMGQAEYRLGPTGAGSLPKAVGGASYGSMPAASVSRTIDAKLLAETVSFGDVTDFSFAELLDGLKTFMEKWRLEDADKPAPVSPVMQPPPSTQP